MTHEEENVAVVTAAITALNERDLDRFFSLHTDDTTSHEVFFPRPLERDEFREFLHEFFVAYPDAAISTQSIVAQGDLVAVENIMEATFAGPFRGEPPTGRKYSIREGVFFELENGLIRRARIYLDRESIREQIEPGSET